LSPATQQGPCSCAGRNPFPSECARGIDYGAYLRFHEHRSVLCLSSGTPVPSYYCQPWVVSFKLVQIRRGPAATPDDLVSGVTAVPAAVQI
jgi:hypothetical protein